jgi:hypothetical protein
MAQAPRLPPQFYRLVPALYPHFAKVVHSAGVTGPEFLCLSYVRKAGKEVEPGLSVLPIAELKLMLLNFGAYASESGALGFITNHLQNERGYLKHHRLTPGEKQKLFPGVGGYRDAVALTGVGREKLAAIDRGSENLFRRITSNISSSTLANFMSFLAPFAEEAVKRLEMMAEDSKNNTGSPPPRAKKIASPWPGNRS